MNSYFATCEQQDNKELRGKPVGVCEHLGGIIIAASIEAKKIGIKTGTPVWEAKKIYPNIALLPTRAERYREITRGFLKIFRDYTDHVDVFSIDEAFLDVTHICCVRQYKLGKWVKVDPFLEAKYLALEIKQRIRSEVGDWLSCSIGIGENKLVAKLGSDMQKPDGLVIIRPEDKNKVIESISLTDIPGIGNRMARRLALLGIHTLKDLSVYPESNLISRFGILGHHLARYGRLEGNVGEFARRGSGIKSMGHMYTLPQQWRIPGQLLPLLQRLSDMVARRMRNQNLTATSVIAYFSTTDDESYGGFKEKLPLFSSGRELFYYAEQVLKSKTTRSLNKISIKFIGVTAGGLSPQIDQLTLFPYLNKAKRIAQALDSIDEKYGSGTIGFAGSFQALSAFRDSVGFGRVKEL
jgi:DNA polymerase-4